MKFAKFAIASLLSLATVAVSPASHAGDMDGAFMPLTVTFYGAIGAAVIATAVSVGQSTTAAQDDNTFVAKMIEGLEQEIGKERTEVLVKQMNNCEIIDSSDYASSQYAQGVINAYLSQRASVCR